jgi:hypothetical protein
VSEPARSTAANERREQKEVDMGNNAERLEAAGLIKKTPLPEAYESIIAGLSEQEVDALVGVSTQLSYATHNNTH